ncbi:hypothetical protein [Alicyclobacillus mengziensis]|uniref:Uncharacterized protein n=1 Tax=Alicyclobacillus mengziensis TaxID=2931921 RepID=A0A9X7VWC1_9BACL|nr:hypothetical protein [Alicyclobacillus mengziensis]QSO45824.1 hypothetical protein JZ786_14900 [Alicyclobacillus mengziensis]
MKIVIEIVRSIFVLSLTAFLASLLFTGYWLFQRYNFNTTANGTTVHSFAKAYTELGIDAWLRANAWMFIDVGLAVFTMLLGVLWRVCVKIREKRMEAKYGPGVHNL